MDNYSNKLLEEYFHETTSDMRRGELRNEIMQLPSDDPDRIIFELGEEIEVEEKVQKLSSAIDSIENKRRRNWPLKIAASVIIILGSVFIGIELSKSDTSNEDLFNTYFLPYDGVDVSRDSSQPEYPGMGAYNNKRYQEALDIFQNKFEADGNPEIALLISSCYLSIGNSEQALSWLNQVTDNANRKLIHNRDWYKALALINMGQTAEGIVLLQKIIEMNSPFSERASRLLTDLDSQ